MFKKLGFISLMLLVVGTGCADEGIEETTETDDVEIVEETAEVEEVEEIEEEPEEIEEIEETAEEIEFSREDKLSLAVMIMQSDFEEIANVEYDAEQDAIVIIPTEQGFSDELLYMMTGLMDRASWDSMVENFQYLSETMTELVDADLKFAIANPENTDNMILVVQDGVVMYNVADELE